MSGQGSFAGNEGNTVSGNKSAVFGEGNTAPSDHEMVVGAFATNYTPLSNATDRVFTIGIGAGNTSRDNALTVLKNGKSGFGDDTPTSTVDINGTFATTVITGQTAGSNDPDESATIWIYSTGSGTIFLPAANTCINRRYIIVNNTGGARSISSYRALGGAASTTIGNGASLELVSDGTNWYQIK